MAMIRGIRRQKVNPEALWGIRTIATAMGCHHSTILKWIRTLDFPAFMHPEGCWVTTRTAIARWVEINMLAQRQEKEERDLAKLADDAVTFVRSGEEWPKDFEKRKRWNKRKGESPPDA